jgi:hypothetical protein
LYRLVIRASPVRVISLPPSPIDVVQLRAVVGDECGARGTGVDAADPNRMVKVNLCSALSCRLSSVVTRTCTLVVPAVLASVTATQLMCHQSTA